MKNGSGLRVVLWISGCSHHCYNCQNPQTWDINSGILFDKQAKEELFRELDKDYISGLTLSGGDPLNESNLDEVLNLVNQIRLLYGNTKTIWLYTGYDFNVIADESHKDDLRNLGNNNLTDMQKRWEIISKCDVLVDGRYVDELKDPSLAWCGSSNQRVIDVQETLQKGEIVLWR